MSDYVRARVERLLETTRAADHAPRRARFPTVHSDEAPLPEPYQEDEQDQEGEEGEEDQQDRADQEDRDDRAARVVEPGGDRGVADDDGAGLSPAAELIGDPVGQRPEPVRTPWWAVAGGFFRAHALVVGLICLLGVGLAGYTVLRARPVALTVPAQAQTLGASTPMVTPSQSTVSSPGVTGSAPAASAPATGVASGPAATVRIAVHVLGAVHHPGVVELPPGARVVDAITATGGLRDDAAPAELNLAQVLVDGQQILIGTSRHPAGEVRTGSGGTRTASAGPSAAAGSTAASEPMDLNAATAIQLEELPGVGPVTAASIVAWRDQHGRFSRIEELQEIDGIGPKTYARLAPHVRV